MITSPAWPETTRPLAGGWVVSVEHTASSYGIPVLVSPEGLPFGPGDFLSVPDVAEMRGIGSQTLNAYLQRGLGSAGRGWVKIGRKGGWAIRAADAVRASA